MIERRSENTWGYFGTIRRRTYPHEQRRSHRERGRVQRDLVERARRGDQSSFAVLAELSIARLYNVAQLMLADSDLAHDAVQEALIMAWRDLRGLRDADAF